MRRIEQTDGRRAPLSPALLPTEAEHGLGQAGVEGQELSAVSQSARAQYLRHHDTLQDNGRGLELAGEPGLKLQHFDERQMHLNSLAKHLPQSDTCNSQLAKRVIQLTVRGFKA